MLILIVVLFNVYLFFGVVVTVAGYFIAERVRESQPNNESIQIIDAHKKSFVAWTMVAWPLAVAVFLGVALARKF